MKLALTLLLMCLMTCPLRAANFYVANGAGVTCSDAAAGTKANPWCNAPDMTGYSGSHTPVAGDVFIFRGCDTWTASGTTWTNITQSGSSTANRISYGGFDQTWYNSTVCPGGWNRPIISGGGTWPGTANPGKAFAVPGSHIEIAWFEFTNMAVTGAGTLLLIDENVSADLAVHDNYVHGMLASALSGGSASMLVQGISTCSAGLIYNNYVDLSDSSALAQADWQAVFSNCSPSMYKNYFSNLGTCANGSFQTVHDNWFNNCAVNNGGSPPNGLHQNNFESNGESASTTYYNNLSTNVFGASPIQFQIGPKNVSNTAYVFNNVGASTASSAAFFSCSTGVDGTPAQGTCLEFNNTIECGNDPSPSAGCTQNGDHTGPYPTVNSQYNHWITSAASPYVLKNSTTINATGDKQQSAPGGGYTISNYFAPTSGAGITVGAGGAASTMLGYCTTITSFDSAAGTACQSDSTQGVSINTVTHQVTGLARATVLRPATGNWDAGAYQYSSGTPATPAPAPGMMLAKSLADQERPQAVTIASQGAAK